MRDFNKLEIYQQGEDFVYEIYKITREFPADERFGLVSQLRRASVSITNNIAEGCSRKTDKDFRRFLEISRGSAFEVESMLKLSIRLEFITESIGKGLIEEIKIIQKRLYRLHDSIG